MKNMKLLEDASDTLQRVLDENEMSQWSRLGVIKSKAGLDDFIHGEKLELKIDGILEMLKSHKTNCSVEYERCKKDPKYFIEKYVKIRSIEGGLVEFKLNEAQKIILNGYHKNNKCRISKPRQSGITTLTLAYVLYCITFNLNEQVAFFTLSLASARNAASTFDIMYDNLPDFIRVNKIKNNEREKDFSNRNSLIFRTYNMSNALRGRSINRGYFDEYRWMSKDFLMWVYPCVSANKNIKLGYYSSNKKDSFICPACDWVMSFDYRYDPKHDSKWVAEKIRQIGLEAFENEYCT